MRFDLLYEVGFWLCTYQLVDYFTILDEQYRGNGGDAIIHRKLGLWSTFTLPTLIFPCILSKILR